MRIEEYIEKEARKYAESLGGVSMKFVSPGNTGVPDRVLSHINSGAFFCEYKPPGDKLKAHQVKRCTEMAAMGFRIYAGENWEGVCSIKQAKEIIEDEFFNRPRRHSLVSGL